MASKYVYSLRFPYTFVPQQYHRLLCLWLETKGSYLGFFCWVSIYWGVLKCHPGRTECSSCGLTMTFQFLETVLWCVTGRQVDAVKHAHAGDSELLVFTCLYPMKLFPFCRSLEHCRLSKVWHCSHIKLHIWTLITGQLAATNLRL